METRWTSGARALREARQEEDKQTTARSKRAWLYRLRDAKRAEAELLAEINQLEADAILPSTRIDGMPHGRMADTDLSGFAARYDELYRWLRKQLSLRIEIQRQVTEAIEAAPRLTEAQRCVLRYYFVMGKSIEEICVAMSYSYRHVVRLRKQAIEAFDLPDRVLQCPNELT